ncbi:hypothetical protein [Ligilactobacillus ruminis]|uniref:hypothetical protein n=1 Tax=Ligilactobacillus ruminis TaxID=1623 RepID=UPI0022E3338C|nr:hypothetical protein [Ligilactobacillus ruminis]
MKKAEKTHRLQEDDRQSELFDPEEEQSEKTEDSKEVSVKSYTKKTGRLILQKFWSKL